MFIACAIFEKPNYMINHQHHKEAHADVMTGQLAKTCTPQATKKDKKKKQKQLTRFRNEFVQPTQLVALSLSNHTTSKQQKHRYKK